MTTLPIVIEPDQRLHQKSEPVAKVDDDIRKLMDDMAETMYECHGIGLAAVQVGVHKRVLVMDLEYGSSRYDEQGNENANAKPNPIYMANPEVIEESDEKNVYEEGCLSFPGQYAKVTRPKAVKVKYLDYNGKEQVIDCDELLATCVQHEIDHLDGIVFVDHLSKLKREMILRKLKKQQIKRVKCPLYKIPY